jgi:hypothetical protein
MATTVGGRRQTSSAPPERVPRRSRGDLGDPRVPLADPPAPGTLDRNKPGWSKASGLGAYASGLNARGAGRPHHRHPERFFGRDHPPYACQLPRGLASSRDAVPATHGRRVLRPGGAELDRPPYRWCATPNDDPSRVLQRAYAELSTNSRRDGGGASAPAPVKLAQTVLQLALGRAAAWRMIPATLAALWILVLATGLRSATAVPEVSPRPGGRIVVGTSSPANALRPSVRVVEVITTDQWEAHARRLHDPYRAARSVPGWPPVR